MNADALGAPVCDLCGRSDRTCVIVAFAGRDWAICRKHAGTDGAALIVRHLVALAEVEP